MYYILWPLAPWEYKLCFPNNWNSFRLIIYRRIWTPILIPSDTWIFRVNLLYTYTNPFASWYFTKNEVRLYEYCEATVDHNAKLYILVSGFLANSVFLYALDHMNMCLARRWWYYNTKSARRTSLHHRKEQIKILNNRAPRHTFPRYPEVAVRINVLRGNCWQPQSKTSDMKVLDIIMV